jgi:periplasmic protein TonB
MFSTLERTRDRSARRGWTTLASFGFQAMALSLLLLIPLLTIQGPPKLQWFTSLPVPAPPPAPAPPAGVEQPSHGSNLSGTHILEPRTIPPTIAIFTEQPVAAAPNIDEGGGVMGATGTRGQGVMSSIGTTVALAPLSASPPSHRLRISRWSEGNLIYRVQPIYSPLARQAHIQGAVELRAIISKAGTIENLTVLRGHPMLVPAAISAVRQWRYRPYLLNNEPIEVETEITVNFILGER